MFAIDRLKNGPMAISLSGWILFYAGLLSAVGLALLVVITKDLVQAGDIAETFGTRMGTLFGLAGIVSLVVFGWALRQWSRHFLKSMKLYGLIDVAMVAVIGLSMGSIIWFGAWPKD